MSTALDNAPVVLAIVVAHNGAAWLPTALAALANQTYKNLRVVAVDNGSTDTSRQILLRTFTPQRVLVAERDIGFPAAVSMALDSGIAARSGAEWILLVHDDLVLEAHAVERLVRHAVRDPSLAAAGPKLLRHDAPSILQQVGMSIDLTGRTDSGLEPDELDQGQRDRVRPVLYVTTAGMLVRRQILEDLGRFDRRYHVFRDDLDFCWRAWLSGYHVEVVPDAVGRHARASANYLRPGRTSQVGARYLAERNTLATMLKCYGPRRLALVVPLFFLVGTAKIVGFIATRRVGDAWQTVRAWGWNLLHLPETLRLRRPVQDGRLRTDADLKPLFAKIAPRLRAYAEAVAERVAGTGDIPPPPTEVDDETASFARRLGRFIATHPTMVVALLLGLFGLIAAAPLLGRGQLRGGDLAPWPAGTRTFLRAYASGWSDSGMGSGTAPSPAQALLGLLDIIVLGSDWLAQRALLLGVFPVAWLVSLHAAGLVTDRRAARLAAATAYVLSPPAIAALTTGRVGALVAVPLLPALALTGARMVRPGSAATTAWRASAGSAVLAAVLIAFVPAAAPVVLLASAVTLMALLLVPTSAATTNAAIARVLTATVLAFILLLPWSAGLIGPGSPVVGGLVASGAVADEFQRWLVLSPALPGFPTAIVGAGLLVAGLLGLVLGFLRRPALVGTAWSLVLLSVLTAWALGRAGPDAPAWPGAPLLLAALCLAGLLAVAVAAGAESLREHDLGWRHVAVVVSGVAIVASLGAAAVHLVGEPWDAYTSDDGPLPAFIVADPRVEGPYRVLVLGDDGGVTRWDVTGPDGPTMLNFGTTAPEQLVGLIGRAVEDISADSDPAAAARLGLANVLYVYVPEGGRSDELEAVLGDQFDLEPQPLEQGLLYRVQRWLPRAAFVPPNVAAALVRRPELPMDAQVIALEERADDVYTGAVPGIGAVLLSEAAGDGWVVEAGDTEIEPIPSNALLQFTVDQPVSELTVRFGRQSGRTLAVALEAVAAVLALSLVLRPPRFAEQQQ